MLNKMESLAGSKHIWFIFICPADFQVTAAMFAELELQ